MRFANIDMFLATILLCVEPRLIDPMLSPFGTIFSVSRRRAYNLNFAIVILFSGVLVGIKKVFFDPNRSKQDELVSIHEINRSEDNNGKVDEQSKSSSKKYTTDKVENFNDKNSELQIELGASLSLKRLHGDNLFVFIYTLNMILDKNNVGYPIDQL